MFRHIALLGAAILASALLAPPAVAADVEIVSMHYSRDHMVPHIHFDGGVEPGDVERVAEIVDRFVRCRAECMPALGSPVAVLTLNSLGGDYGTGLLLADYLRANHIATSVERGMVCYSACAFAWLGGSGYAADEYVGTYIERMVDPGAILGFHAPYRDEQSLISALAERSASAIMGESRNAMALMIRELVKWNVDSEVLFWMLSMGPDQTYDILGADDYYLVRAALPPSTTAAWVTDLPTAVRNACIRLLANHERADPFLLRDRITTAFEYDLAETRFGEALHGYRISERLFDVAYCAITDSSIDSGDYEIGLYLHLSQATSIMTFFNRQHGWSSLGTGGNPTKRIMQRGAMNHYFLPLGQTVDSLDLPGEMEILERRFFTLFRPDFPTLPPELEIVSQTLSSRVSRSGDLWVFEQVGDQSLVAAALTQDWAGVTYTTDAGNDQSFIRNGTYPNGAAFSWFGLPGGAGSTGSALVRIELIKPDGSAPNDADLTRMAVLGCAIAFYDSRLACN